MNLETITNYNEGLLYQKTNIERQIENNENVQVNNIEKVESFSLLKLDRSNQRELLAPWKDLIPGKTWGTRHPNQPRAKQRARKKKKIEV